MTGSTPLSPTRSKSWWAENWAPLAVVWLISLLPFLPVLLSGKVLVSLDQAGAPGWKFYFDALRSGTIPLWNPYVLGGMPTFDLMFGDGSYPPFILLGFLFPATYVVTANYVLHLLLGGFTAYLLTRVQFRLDRWIAAALALAWAMNPHVISYVFAGHTGKYFVLAWLPLGLMFLLRALSRAATWKDLLGLALVSAAFVLTSHLQFTYFTMMGFFVVWMFHVGRALRDRNVGEAGSLAVRFWAPVLLGIGLSFYIFLPPMKYTKEFGIRGEGERTSFEHATSWSMHPEEVPSLLVPEFVGWDATYWGRNPVKLNTESPGVVVWFLGLLCLFAFRRSRWYWLWAGIGILSLLYGLAAHTPVFGLFYKFVPGIKNFRAASMMLFWLSMALLVMSAETLRRLLAQGKDAISSADREKIAKRLRVVGWSVTGALLLFAVLPGVVYGIWGSFVDESLIPGLARQEYARPIFAMGCVRGAALTAFLAWAVYSMLLRARRPFAFGMALLCAVAVDTYWVDLNVSARIAGPQGMPVSGFIEGQPPGVGFASEPAVEYLKAAADTSRFRVFGLPGAYEWRYGQYHGIETIDGWTDNEMKTFRAYRGNDYQNNPNLMKGLKQNPADGSVSGSALLDMLNVGYVAFRVREAPGMQLVRNTSALPRTWFVPHWEAVTDTQALAGILAPGFDPRRTVLVSGGPESGLASGGAAPDSGARLLSATEKARGYNRSVYEIDAPVEGVLVFSELWFPHWKATVDGREAPVLRADFAFRGLHLTPGHHEVEFTYHSPWLRTGFIVALASAVGLVLLCLAYARFGQRGAPKGSA